jgi:putative transposase
MASVGAQPMQAGAGEESSVFIYGKRRRLAEFDYANAEVAYFVTIRAAPQTSPFRDDRLAQIVVSALDWLRANRGVQLHAYCVMPDHLHLLLRLGEGGQPLGTIIGILKAYTTKQSRALGCKGALWQNRFHDHILRKNEDALGIAEYIRQNPVRRGLARTPEEYQWSGFPDPI